jgi:hypothetical protein
MNIMPLDTTLPLYFLYIFIGRGYKTNKISEEWQMSMKITARAREKYKDLKMVGSVFLMMSVLGGRRL